MGKGRILGRVLDGRDGEGKRPSPLSSGPKPEPSTTKCLGTTKDRSPSRGGEWLRPMARERDLGLSHRGAVSLCAEHVRQPGGASPLHNLMEVKC